MTSPYDGERVGTSTTPVFFEGYLNVPDAGIIISAKSRISGQFAQIGTATSESEVYWVGDDSDVYRWSTSIVLSSNYWFPGFKGHTAFIRSRYSTTPLTTVDQDWLQCYFDNDQNGSAFLANCKSENSPEAQIYTDDYCAEKPVLLSHPTSPTPANSYLEFMMIEPTSEGKKLHFNAFVYTDHPLSTNGMGQVASFMFRGNLNGVDYPVATCTSNGQSSVSGLIRTDLSCHHTIYDHTVPDCIIHQWLDSQGNDIPLLLEANLAKGTSCEIHPSVDDAPNYRVRHTIPSECIPQPEEDYDGEWWDIPCYCYYNDGYVHWEDVGMVRACNYGGLGFDLRCFFLEQALNAPQPGNFLDCAYLPGITGPATKREDLGMCEAADWNWYYIDPF